MPLLKRKSVTQQAVQGLRHLLIKYIFVFSYLIIDLSPLILYSLPDLVISDHKPYRRSVLVSRVAAVLSLMQTMENSWAQMGESW